MSNPSHRKLTVRVVEIQGHCPVYRVGDTFTIADGYKLVSECAVCMHALQSLNPYYVPLSRGLAPRELGIAGQDGAAYVQCLDPQRYTDGGTVTFRVATEGKEVSRPSSIEQHDNP
ncbi:MAG: TIGR04076 family protein [Chloroflexi bacterium]|nr:TIGR04076 family protein [Chloroflexota bacterium]